MRIYYILERNEPSTSLEKADSNIPPKETMLNGFTGARCCCSTSHNSGGLMWRDFWRHSCTTSRFAIWEASSTACASPEPTFQLHASIYSSPKSFLCRKYCATKHVRASNARPLCFAPTALPDCCRRRSLQGVISLVEGTTQAPTANAGATLPAQPRWPTSRPEACDLLAVTMTFLVSTLHRRSTL